MDDRIKIFIDNLKSKLEGLPEGEVSEAVSYYEEYLAESLDAGNDPDEVLVEIGSPEKIAEILKMETNITRAANDPRFRNFTKVIGDAFKSVSTPLSVFSLSITALISFSVVALIFGGAAVCWTGAAAVILVCIYQAFTMPAHFFMEILGTLGAGLLMGGIISIAAFYLWICGRLFIRLSTKQIGLMLKLSGKKASKPVRQEKRRLWPVTRFLLIVSAAGFILFGVSGLPVRFFTIFNSMKPEGNVKNIAAEYNPGEVSKISVTTAHSIIRIGEGSQNKIVVTYEEPDWMAYEIGNKGGTLFFSEKSNGRLPFFDLVSIHDSQTALSILLPRGFKADSISLQSTGGFIYISGISGNVEAKTLTGKIQYDPGTSKSSIFARTGSGDILVNGAEAGKKSEGWKEYNNGVNNNRMVKLTSTSGSIVINR